MEKFDKSKFDRMINVSNALGLYLKDMNTDTWSNLSGMICPNGKTVWQMILHVEPNFPKVGRTYDKNYKMETDWSEIPTNIVAIRACRYGESDEWSLDS